jgi:hypothetical protein
MPRDFTRKKLIELYTTALVADYKIFTVLDFLNNRPIEKAIILRHDVDANPFDALELAKTERELGVRATYYFRAIPQIFIPEIIRQVAEMGHEVGYHYESLNEANGDIEKAIQAFQRNLGRFREVRDVKTICPHGGPVAKGSSPYSCRGLLSIAKAVIAKKKIFSQLDNSNMWTEHNLGDYKLEGDAKLSLDLPALTYISDTGRSWKIRYKSSSDIPTKSKMAEFESTAELIKSIKNKEFGTLYVLVHPEHWQARFLGWLWWITLIRIRRFFKALLYRNTLKLDVCEGGA